MNLTNIGQFVQSLFNQASNLKLPTQAIPFVGSSIANLQRVQSAQQAPTPQLKIQALNQTPTFTPKDVYNQVAPIWQIPLKTAAQLNMSVPNSLYNTPQVQQGLKTPLGQILFGNEPLKSYPQRYQEGYQLPVLGRVQGVASLPLFGLGIAAGLMPITGGAKTKAGLEIKNLALNSKTVSEFRTALESATPEAKVFLQKTIRDAKNPFNSVEDIFNSVKSKTLTPLRENVRPGSFSNLRIADNRLAPISGEIPKPNLSNLNPEGRQITAEDLRTMKKGYNPEPLPWETPQYLKDNPINPYYNKQEADTAIIKGIVNSEKSKPWQTAFSKVSPDIQQAVKQWSADTKVSQVEANKVAYFFHTKLNPELEYNLVKYSQNPTLKTADFLGLTESDLAKGMEVLRKNREFNDNLFARAKNAGVDLNYLKNHIIQAFKETPGQIDEALKAKGLGGKPGFANRRTISSFQKGEEYGLTPRYTTFSQLNALAEHELQKAISNKTLFDKLIYSGQILPSNTPDLPADWKLIEAPFFPQASKQTNKGQTIITQYKAPKELADLLNNIFGTQSQTLGSTALRYGGKISSTMQDVALSGGIGPLNFFGINQIIKEATAGRIFKPAGAFLRSFSGSLSKDFEIANAEFIKEMATQGISPRGTANYQTLYKNVKYSKTLKELVGEGWNKIVNEPTFGRLMHQLQVEFYKDTKSALLKKGYIENKAIATAGQAVKNFYGINENLGRAKDIDNALSTVFLAPKYRESMINIFANIFKGLNPKNYGKPEYAGVQRLAAGMAITYGLYNAVQIKLTGKPMWNNPPGKEFELVIPVGDPKDKKYISTPWMPGFTAIPRRIAGTGASLIKGDIPEAGKQFSSLFSIPVSKLGELASNQDYFGNPIYGEGTTPLQTATYGINSFLPGYARGLTDVATGRATPAFGVGEMLELPIRKGTYPNPYYTAIDAELKKLPLDKRDNASFLIKSNKQGGPDSQTEAKMMINDPALFQFKRNITLASNPNDPLYSRSISDIQAYFAYQATSDTATKAKIRVLYPWIPQIQFALSNQIYNSQQAKINPTAGYNPNSLQGQLGAWFNPAKPVNTTNFIEKPTLNPMQQLTEEQVKIVSLYTSLPQGSIQRKQLLATNPWLKDYWNANTAYYKANPYSTGGALGNYLASIGINTQSSSNTHSPYTKKISIKLSSSPKFKSITIKKAKIPTVKIAKNTFKVAKSKKPTYMFKSKPIRVKITKKLSSSIFG